MVLTSFAFSGLNLEQYEAQTKSVKHVTDLPVAPNQDGNELFDDDIGRLYQWSDATFGGQYPSSANLSGWKLYIPTADSSLTNAFNYPSAMVGFSDTTTGQNGAIKADYVGPASPIEWQFISQSNDDMAFSTSAPNVFVHSGSGTDAIQVKTGKNVLDGGLGSNFLIGGDGNDTFFTDARGSGVTWSTLGNFHAGDAATLWGFVPGKSSYYWEANAGAAGFQGATLRADIDGNGSIDASITFAGLSLNQAQHLSTSTGTQQAGPYLYLFNPGV